MKARMPSHSLPPLSRIFSSKFRIATIDKIVGRISGSCKRPTLHRPLLLIFLTASLLAETAVGKSQSSSSCGRSADETPHNTNAIAEIDADIRSRSCSVIAKFRAGDPNSENRSHSVEYLYPGRDT